jgi:hypothetical protein
MLMKYLFKKLQYLYNAIVGAFSGGPSKVQKTYRVSFEVALAACQEAIRQCHFFERSVDEVAGTIMATTKPSIWSWGEEINIRIISFKNETNAIKITSSPKAQLFDWGKSGSNEERLFDKLSTLLEEVP